MGEVIRGAIKITDEERAEKGLLSDAQLEELAEKHGRIAHAIGANGRWEIVLRPPTRDEHRAFKSDILNPMTKALAQERYVERLMIHAAEAGGKTLEPKALIDRWPGIPEGVSDEFCALTGLATDEEKKG